MSDIIEVKVVGHTEKTLRFYPMASTGGIVNGVGFENGNNGGWVVSYDDFMRMVDLAAKARMTDDGMKVAK